jgi:Na+/melibiose symporter-like transporter
MADISAVFGTLLTLGIVFPGLLSAWWLLFPASVDRAQERLELTPWRCFWLGGVATAILVVPVVVLLALPFGPAKLAGWVLMLTTLAVASLGAAGLAARMGQRLQHLSPSQTPLGAFVRGAVTLELAAAFPVVGWFFVIPLTLVTALGATLFALLRWAPSQATARTAANPQPQTAPQA